MKTKVKIFTVLLSCFVLIFTMSFSTVAVEPLNPGEGLPVYAESVLAVHTGPDGTFCCFNKLFDFDEDYGIDIEAEHRRIKEDTTLSEAQRVELVLALEEQYNAAKEAYLATLAPDECRYYTFTCVTDTSEHEITLTYTKEEILDFSVVETTPSESVTLSYEIPSSTEAIFRVTVSNDWDTVNAKIVYTLVDGFLRIDSCGTGT